MSIMNSSNSPRFPAEPATHAFKQAGLRPVVLALDLEGTLISNSVSQFPRPFVSDFLEQASRLFPRLVMFTTVPERLFRQIAGTLVTEQAVPPWFQELECVEWDGRTKDLAFIRDCNVDETLLVDDYAAYVHPGQESQWVQVQPFEPPFESSDDSELRQVLVRLEERLRTGLTS